MQTFKDRLKILMKNSKPYTFARKCGIDKGLFQNYWQKGKIPTFETLLKLQKTTGCSLDWLLTGNLPALDGAVEKLSLKPSRGDTGNRRRRLVQTARAIKRLYETASDERLKAVETFVEALHASSKNKQRRKEARKRKP